MVFNKKRIGIQIRYQIENILYLMSSTWKVLDKSYFPEFNRKRNWIPIWGVREKTTRPTRKAFRMRFYSISNFDFCRAAAAPEKGHFLHKVIVIAVNSNGNFQLDVKKKITPWDSIWWAKLTSPLILRSGNRWRWRSRDVVVTSQIESSNKNCKYLADKIYVMHGKYLYNIIIRIFEE